MKPPEERNDSDKSVLSKVDQFLEPLFTDPTLRPLLLVVGLVFVTFGTALVLLAARERSPFAMFSVVVLVIMSVEFVQRDIRRGGFGPISRIVLGLWTGTGLCAGGILWMGWY